MTPKDKIPGKSDLRILFLATDAHGGFGGISQYNRDVLEAFSGLESVGRVDVLPRVAIASLGALPPKVHYDLSGLGGRLKFITAVANKSINSNYDLIYNAHVNLLPAATLAKFISGAPTALAIYGIDVWEDRGWLARMLVRSYVDSLLSISQVTLDRFQAWAKLPSDKLHLVPNAIHLDEYGLGAPSKILRAKFGLDGKVVIMTMGRMVGRERYKGFDEMLEILPALVLDIPNVTLLFVGDGDDRARLQHQVLQTGLGHHVVFTGRVSEAEKSEVFRLADVYAMPSSGEGFGFVVLEALASGVPVVASSSDGTREAVLDGKLGPAVDPRDHHALRAAILHAIKAPRVVPDGLSYFAFPNFQARLRSALAPICEI